MKNRILGAALAACLLLAGCGSTEKEIENAQENQEAIASEALLLELVQRGFPDYRGKKMQPYTGNITECVSTLGEFDSDELLIYQVFTDPNYPSNYQVIAISKDLQYFFILSHVDGALYDIRDLPAYIHEGEYGPDDAEQKLERYLIKNTVIDPLEYDFYTEAKHIDGADNYYIALNRKGVKDWSKHSFEFYVSKDLTRIAQILYDDASRPQYTYLIDED